MGPVRGGGGESVSVDLRSSLFLLLERFPSSVYSQPPVGFTAHSAYSRKPSRLLLCQGLLPPLVPCNRESQA